MSKGQPKLMRTANELAGLALAPCHHVSPSNSYLSIYLFCWMRRHPVNTWKSKPMGKASSLWVMCTRSARVTRSQPQAPTHPSPPHPSPAPMQGFPWVQGPSQNTSCPVSRPSQAPQPDEDGDGHGICIAALLLSLQENPSAWKVPLPCQHMAGRLCRGG